MNEVQQSSDILVSEQRSHGYYNSPRCSLSNEIKSLIETQPALHISVVSCSSFPFYLGFAYWNRNSKLTRKYE